MTSIDSKLLINTLTMHYHNKAVLHGISIALEAGDIGCLLGPSGCGKTSLLRIIAGFERPTQGDVTLDEQLISSPTHHTPPEKRNIGMVFQDYALFPHLSIAQNIAFGIRHKNQHEQHLRVTELLDLVNLNGYQERYPHELSGGQQQRIALARALAPKPDLLLLDEPFGSQDAELREMLAREVRRILKQEQATAILVTHDHHEAFAMADKIGVIQQGQLQQWDSPYNLYHRPNNQFVAEFVGQGSIIEGEVISHDTIATVLGVINGGVPEDSPVGSKVNVLIRPDDIQVTVDSPRQAVITTRIFRGAQFLYTLALADGRELVTLTPSHQFYNIGDKVGFNLDMQHLIILPPTT